MEKDIEILGQQLHYDETGPADGRPVVLMHGWGCNFTTVRSIAAAIESGMHVYNLDLPGHGKSPEPPTVWGVDDYTRLVAGFIDLLGLEDPVLIGHSFGGRIAIMLSAQRPLSKIMLVDAAGIKPKRPLKYYIKVYSFKAAKKILPVVLGKKRGKKAIEAWRGRAGSADYRQSSPMMRNIMSKCINQDLTPLLPSIKAETLLVWGGKDTATPLRDAKLMDRRIPGAGLVCFPDAGHYSFLDEAAQFRAVAREFFKKELAPRKTI